jgi:sec-independent protein translocase protein TatA
MPIGPTELIIILVIVVLLFGARKLPELARGLGQSAKEFRKGLSEDDKKPEEAKPEQKQS